MFASDIIWFFVGRCGHIITTKSPLADARGYKCRPSAGLRDLRTVAVLFLA